MRTPRRWIAAGALCAMVVAVLAYLLVVRSGSDEDAPPQGARVEPVGSSAKDGARGHALVWAVGDGADAGDHGRAVAELIRRSRPARVLYLGDVYSDDTAAGFRRSYESTYGPLAPITAPTPGNHPSGRQGYDRYWAQVTGERPASYYAFRVAGWQVLSLNSELYPEDEEDQDGEQPDTGDREQTAQLRWLRDQVGEAGTCRIAFWHRPRFSAGTGHGDDPGVDPLWSALRERAAIVINGHEHDMQRMRPRDGITQFIAGAGGYQTLYPINRRDRRLAFGDDHHFGALRLTLRPGRADWAFIAQTGATLDSGSLRCAQS
jgi:hypothetical protein